MQSLEGTAIYAEPLHAWSCPNCSKPLSILIPHLTLLFSSGGPGLMLPLDAQVLLGNLITVLVSSILPFSHIAKVPAVLMNKSTNIMYLSSSR